MRALVEQTAEAAFENLTRAQEHFSQAVQEGGWDVRPRDTQGPGAASFAGRSACSRMVDTATESEPLSAMHLLERRLQALRVDTFKIASRCGAFGRALRISKDQARPAAEKLRIGSGIFHRDCAEPPTLDNGAQRTDVQLQTVDFQYPNTKGQPQRAKVGSRRADDRS